MNRFDAISPTYCIRIGANVREACRSRQELSNEYSKEYLLFTIYYLLAKIGFDTTEKPANVSMKEPHGKGAAKPRKKLQKRPRSFWHDGKHHIVK